MKIALVSAQTNPGGSISCKIIMQSIPEPNINDFGLSDVVYFLHRYPHHQSEYPKQIGVPSNQVPASPPGSQKSKEGKHWRCFGIVLILLTVWFLS